MPPETSVVVNLPLELIHVTLEPFRTRDDGLPVTYLATCSLWFVIDPCYHP